MLGGQYGRGDLITHRYGRYLTDVSATHDRECQPTITPRTHTSRVWVSTTQYRTHLDHLTDHVRFITTHPIHHTIFTQIILTAQSFECVLQDWEVNQDRSTTISFMQTLNILSDQLRLPVEIFGYPQQLFVIEQRFSTRPRFDHGTIQIPDTIYITNGDRMCEDVRVDVSRITPWTKRLQ
ncbi:hypothetical protein D3C87_1156700 [compost metagenome]